MNGIVNALVLIIHLFLHKVLERGERIELLVDKTDHLSSEAFIFKKEARKLKTKMWWKVGVQA